MLLLVYGHPFTQGWKQKNYYDDNRQIQLLIKVSRIGGTDIFKWSLCIFHSPTSSFVF